MDHYERLGVSPTATRDEIRIAYRALARRHHPDAGGPDSAAVAADRMTQINEAWHTLSDSARRAVYDAAQRNGRRESTTFVAGNDRVASTITTPMTTAVTRVVQPARFPWRFMLVLVALGVGFVLVNAALTSPSKPVPVDHMLSIGSCVDIADNNDAVEVLCDGSNDGIIVSILPVNSICPQNAELHRDRQGLGMVCVQLTSHG